MIALTAALFAGTLLSPVPETYLIDPSDDVWVYPHASDPGKDALMRVWGIEGNAAAAAGQPAGDFSYGYLRFNLSILPKKSKLIEAKLNLTHQPDPGFTAEDAKATPLEARPLNADFDERTWNYDGQITKVFPDPNKDSIFGTGFPANWEAGKPVHFSIDLMSGKGDFASLFAKLTSQDRSFWNVAITSRIDPSAVGRGAIYRVYTKEGDKDNRPVLKIVVERQ